MFYDNLKAICDKKGVKITPLVAECGGAKGSISNWKKGAAPNSDIVLRLAVRLNVSTDYLLTGLEPQPQLSNEQTQMLNILDKLSLVDRAKVMERAETLAELAAERAASQKPKKEVVQKKSGSKKPLRFPAIAEQDEEESCYIDICSLSASAGTGVYLDESRTEPLKIVHTDIADRANYAVKVSGVSMEPLFHDGDIVLVETCPSIEQGEIGVFIVNGVGFIKKYGGNQLISLNPECDNIDLHEYDSVYCRGRVLGIAEKAK